MQNEATGSRYCTYGPHVSRVLGKRTTGTPYRNSRTLDSKRDICSARAASLPSGELERMLDFAACDPILKGTALALAIGLRPRGAPGRFQMSTAAILGSHPSGATV
jgi:hypothetical protein